MMYLLRPGSSAFIQATIDEPCPQPCAPDTPLSKNDMHITLCLAGHGTADTRSPTAIARGNKIVADLVDHAFARVADGAMLSPRTVLCAEIVKSYCAANAPLSVDKIAGSAAVTLAALPRDSNTQVAVDALNVIRLEAANERRVKKKPPIKLEHFWHASRVMSDDAHKLLDGDDCDFKRAGLLVRAVLTIDALPARVHTLAAVQWRSVNALDEETGDKPSFDAYSDTSSGNEYLPRLRAVLGNHTGAGARTKHSFPLDVKLHKPGCLLIFPRAWRAVQLLQKFRAKSDREHGACDGVFPETGRNAFATLFAKRTGHAVGELRRSVEQCAEELYDTKLISAEERGSVHRLCQHNGKTAAEEYTQRRKAGEALINQNWIDMIQQRVAGRDEDEPDFSYPVVAWMDTLLALATADGSIASEDAVAVTAPAQPSPDGSIASEDSVAFTAPAEPDKAYDGIEKIVHEAASISADFSTNSPRSHGVRLQAAVVMALGDDARKRRTPETLVTLCNSATWFAGELYGTQSLLKRQRTTTTEL